MMFIIYLNFFNYQRTKYYEILHVFNSFHRINHQGQTFKPLKKVVNVVKYENNGETKNTKSKN